MSDFTPANMLREYQRQSSEEMLEQAKLFLAMPVKDQRELLFWMVSHLNAGLQVVHALAQSEGATTRAFSDFETPTQ